MSAHWPTDFRYAHVETAKIPKRTARIGLALCRARLGICTVAATYALSVLVGILQVHAGNGFAVGQRDKIVGTAQRESPILRLLNRGNPVAAAALDATGNALAGATALIAGYCPPAGYAFAAYRGWVGGIVSITGGHHSRFAKPYDAFYYVATVLLQLLPASLLGGAGVNLANAAFINQRWTGYSGPRVRFVQIPYDAVRDAGWISLLSMPLFLLASVFEFLA